MKLAEIKNMTKLELIEFLDLYGIEVYPDESKRKILAKAMDLFWSINDNIRVSSRNLYRGTTNESITNR